MKIEGEGKLLRIFIGESDSLHGRMLYDVIVRAAHDAGLVGSTVWRGIEGFGAGSRIHAASILRLSEDLPILIEIVDVEAKVGAFLPRLEAPLEEAGSGGLVTLEKAEVIRYTPGSTGT
jgi:PII-like signaling protein